MEAYTNSMGFIFNQEIWWQVNCGHSSPMYDKLTQMGALYYLLPVTYSSEVMEKDVEEVMVDGKWNKVRLGHIMSEDVINQIIKSIEIKSGEGGMITLS